MKKEEILINKMYTGSYTNSNIGHEVINFFKSDSADGKKEGKSYVYVMPYGGIGKEHNNDKVKLKWIFLTGAKESIKIKNNSYQALEILALRKVKKQLFKKGDFHKKKKGESEEHYKEVIENWKEYHQEQIKMHIKYAGVEVAMIFKDNQNDDTSIYVTYEVEDTIWKPKKRIYLVDLRNEKNINNIIKTENEIYIAIKAKNLPGSSCKSFIDDKGDVNTLYQIIRNRKEYFKEEEAKPVEIKSDESKEEQNKESFFEIMGKENDETSYTNMLYYFFNEKEMINEFIKFLKETKNNINPKVELNIDEYKIEKEKFVIDIENKKRGRMDLVAYGKNNVIIIENKIKSNLNGRQEDGTTQITTYYKCIEKREEERIKEGRTKQKRKIKIMILVPNYKEDILKKELEKECKKIDGKYIIINYKTLYEFFESLKFEEIKSSYEYKEFLKALKLHTYENLGKKIENEMLKKFKSKIVNAVYKDHSD